MTEKRSVLVWRETNGHCVYCAEPISQEERSVDHVLPKSRGGRDHTDNLVPACKACNNRRGLTYPPSILAHPTYVGYVQAKERAQDPLPHHPAIKAARAIHRRKNPIEKVMCFFAGGQVSCGADGIAISMEGKRVALLGWPDIGRAFMQNFTVTTQADANNLNTKDQ